MKDDATLLRRFVEEGSEEAFTELVHRHLDLVYGAASRRTGGDTHAAADVAQQVFTALARQARSLSRHTVLSAWLHTATRNIAVNLMISEQRRKARERAAVVLEVPGTSAATPHWDEVRPALDAAIDELPESDRAAVVLRFLESRPFAEIGVALHLSPDAARMRTERALDKLRGALARRGITSTAAALGTLVTTHSTVSVPAGLATTLVPAALGAATAGGAALGAAGIFLMSTKTIAALTGVVAALGLGFYFGLSRWAEAPLPPLPATPEHVQAIARLREENLRLKADVARLNAANTALKQPAAPPAAPPRAAAVTASRELPAPLPALVAISQQRAMLNNLRMVAAAVDQFHLENKRAPASLEEILGPTKYIRGLNPVDGESYAGVALGRKMPLTVVTPGGLAVTYDPAGALTTDLTAASQQANEEARRVLVERFGVEFVDRLTPSIQKAIAGYRAVHGRPPSAPSDALPYFETPQAGADFLEFSEVARALGMKM